MNLSISGADFWIATALAALMGFAIQRGATCMVAAVDELVRERRTRRLRAMLGAALWVLGGLLVTQALGRAPNLPASYPVTVSTVVGGALLGWGAFVGRACVFGAIARFGSGEWSYLVVPVGFFAACASVEWLYPAAAPVPQSGRSPVLEAGAASTGLLGLAALAWVIHRLRRGRGAEGTESRGLARIWSPSAATTVIGLTFLGMLLLAGPWAYTEVLSDLARRMPHDLAARSALFMALLAGAALGGWMVGRFRHVRASPERLARCLASGALMGWGSVLIPGGNDALILIGMPLLWPHAWVAMLAMAMTIGVAIAASQPLDRVTRADA